MSKISRLDHPTEGPARRQKLAELYADGASRAEMGEAMGVHEDTITTWTQRSDVQALVTELMQQRANKMKRRIDSVLEGRLEHHADQMDTDELLKIRREMAPQRIEIDHTTTQKDAVEELTKEFLGSIDQASAQAAAEEEDPGAAEEEPLSDTSVELHQEGPPLDRPT